MRETGEFVLDRLQRPHYLAALSGPRHHFQEDSMPSLSRTGVLCALAVAFAGSVFAQPPGQLKKAPNQTVQTGQHDEPAESANRTRAASDAGRNRRPRGGPAVVRETGRGRDVHVFRQRHGARRTGRLVHGSDDRHGVPDGSLRYGHVNTAAQQAAGKAAKSVEEAGKAGAKKQAAPAKVKATPSVLEEKE